MGAGVGTSEMRSVCFCSGSVARALRGATVSVVLLVTMPSVTTRLINQCSSSKHVAPD